MSLIWILEEHHLEIVFYRYVELLKNIFSKFLLKRIYIG